MRFSKIISIILHPIFIPFLLFYIIINTSPILYYSVKNSLLYIYSVLFLFTFLLPVISLLIKIKFSVVSSIEISNLKERPLVLFFSLLWFLCGYYFLIPVFHPCPVLKNIYIGGILILLIGGIISKYWKISLHLLSIGGATGIFLGLEKIYADFFFFVILFIILSGFLAYARLKENAHNHRQLYVGFFVGVIVGCICLLY